MKHRRRRRRNPWWHIQAKKGRGLWREFFGRYPTKAAARKTMKNLRRRGLKVRLKTYGSTFLLHPRRKHRRRRSNPGPYRTFKRSATGWESFARARKITVDRGLTWDEARRQCDRFNASRTAAQIRKGTKMEFEQE